MTKPEIAAALREIATLLRIGGEERFKAKAYERAAATVEHTEADLEDLRARRRLATLPGIGKSLANVINELLETGGATVLNRLREQFPPGTAALADVPHLTLKRIELLYQTRGITTRDQLKAACEDGRIRDVPGFGAALEAKILAALQEEQAPRGILLAHALDIAEPLLAWLRRNPAVHRADLVGGARRGEEIVDAIELLAATSEAGAVLDGFAAHPSAIGTLAREPDRVSVRLLGGPIVTVYAAPVFAYVHALLFRTGSPAHVERLSAQARELGLALSPSSLRKDSAPMRARNEQELYAQLGLPFLPPELRDDTGEIEAARDGSLPVDLVGQDDVQGITHAHTVYSDGRNTIMEMATAARAMGMQYLTITDHSPTATYANGVSVAALQKQWDEIARAEDEVGIRLLRGTESDILRDGGLDYAEELLQRFDVVIASIHARHRMDAGEMTERIVRAMRHPIFKIWGHPLGRLLQSRPPFECDVEAILDACADARAAIEINGDPKRLDLEPRWIRAARKRGLKFVLSTDAHSTEALQNLRLAVTIARRGWVTRDEVLNTLPPDEFAAAVRPA